MYPDLTNIEWSRRCRDLHRSYAEDFCPRGLGALDKLSEAMKKLRSLNLSIHLGHDLNLQNLGPLVPDFSHDIKEVSIGQAFISCLYYGLENTHGL